MNDFLGQELKMGDEVVCLIPGYRGLKKSKIVAFTSQCVRLALKDVVQSIDDTHLQYPNQVVKIVKQVNGTLGFD